jgi:hypothetical protein
VPEAPTRVGSGEENNRSKVLPPQKFCGETASNPGKAYGTIEKYKARLMAKGYA